MIALQVHTIMEEVIVLICFKYNVCYFLSFQSYKVFRDETFGLQYQNKEALIEHIEDVVFPLIHFLIVKAYVPLFYLLR